VSGHVSWDVGGRVSLDAGAHVSWVVGGHVSYDVGGHAFWDRGGHVSAPEVFPPPKVQMSYVFDRCINCRSLLV
jgi:hypothetical protein